MLLYNGEGISNNRDKEQKKCVKFSSKSSSKTHLDATLANSNSGLPLEETYPGEVRRNPCDVIKMSIAAALCLPLQSCVKSCWKGAFCTAVIIREQTFEPACRVQLFTRWTKKEPAFVCSFLEVHRSAKER